LSIVRVNDDPILRDKFSTEYLIIDRELYTASKGKRGYKGLRESEEVILGRDYLNDRFDYSNETSREHVKIINQN
jgi:hypothetical protein